jgi:hypothetical protein
MRQSLRHRFEQRVTRTMPQGIVNLFETVEIDVQNGANPTVASGLPKRPIQPIHKRPPVRQFGQGIVKREAVLIGFSR